jgi:valyl-tRNA synthetase
MEIPSKYDPSKTEGKWYDYWVKHDFFHSVPDDRTPYTIVIPPPNVTGVLHMGHMLNNTIQDVLIRGARMQGFNACWVPGIDHASIATEARVVAHLQEKGIDKKELSREAFLEHAWEWKEKHGGIILEQLKKLGASCDWKRTKFTMDDDMSESVIDVFIDLYRKGHIYRGVRMVNWDPSAKTALSDEEVIYREVKSKLYYLKYKIEGEDEFLTIATTRPETILGDTAVCVHPGDERYKKFKGKRILVPLINRSVPIIEDEYVDREFGTGALKITPAHDINDYELGIKHNLESIDIFNDDGTLNDKAEIFIGKDRFEVRKEIVGQLDEEGHLAKVEDYNNKVGFSERTDVPIEPRLSMQWFFRMKEVSKPALKAVMDDTIQLHPAKFKNTYKHWMENIKDWCISRQLWWGQRIPAYYLPNSNEYVIAKSMEEAVMLAREKTGDNAIEAKDLRQDEDVLDTWFSSWLWPISVFDGIRNPGNPDINYYYPTNELVTAPEILFFWVARMIIAGYEYNNEKPFNNVYLTGIVRDKQRRKMSKSLGNSPDPLDLISKYGADGVRVGMLLCSPAGNDLLFDENLTEQGRNFGNKIWNAFRLVKSWKVDEGLEQPGSAVAAIEWFENIFNQELEQLEASFKKYRISEALMIVYKLFWDEFSSWYLEMVKPGYQQPVDKKTYTTTLAFFEKLLKVLHPFMPFITEEIFQLMEKRDEKESIMVSMMPVIQEYDKNTIKQFDHVKEIIGNVRTIRKDNNIPVKESLPMFYLDDSKTYIKHYGSVIEKMANTGSPEKASSKPGNTFGFMVDSAEYFVKAEVTVNVQEEIQKVQEELEYTSGFLKTVMKKLGNERFVQNAPPAVVQKENKKKEDAENKIEALQERLNLLQNQ